MTTEKLQELMQARMAYFGEHLSDERVTAQLTLPNRRFLLRWLSASA